MKSLLKNCYITLLALIPLPREDRVFPTLLNRKNKGGPSRFIWNLERGLIGTKVKTERLFLGRCNWCLIMSFAPFRLFYRLCRWKKVRTILRVDGFFCPIVFDNVIHANRAQRMMTFRRMRINHRIQEGLLFSDWIIYQSHFSKQLTDKYLYCRTECYSVIHNGVDTKHFFPKTEKKELLGRSLRIVALGIWRDRDVAICTLNAFRYVYKRRYKSRLYIIGNMSGEVRRNVQEWIDQQDDQRLVQNIELVGQVGVEQLPSKLAPCDVSFHLKCGDWCPNAVLEMMACGIPVVCHSWGGTVELVGDGGVSVQHEPFCYDDQYCNKCADALDIICAQLDGYSNRARVRAESFDVHKVALQYLEAFERVKKRV